MTVSIICGDPIIIREGHFCSRGGDSTPLLLIKFESPFGGTETRIETHAGDFGVHFPSAILKQPLTLLFPTKRQLFAPLFGRTPNLGDVGVMQKQTSNANDSTFLTAGSTLVGGGVMA